MVNTIARGSRNLETCSSNVQFLANVFINCVSKTIILFYNEVLLFEKTSTFNNCFHNYSLSEAGLVG